MTPEGLRALQRELDLLDPASRRAQTLAATLPLLTVHTPRCEGRAVFGCYVVLRDETGKETSWRIVGPDEADAWSPTHLVVSPGPGTPRDAGVSRAMIERFSGRIPVLGVCLGHQVIVEMHGGRVDRAAMLMHGKPDQVSHDGSPLYAGLPSPFEAGRYHSLAALDEGH